MALGLEPTTSIVDKADVGAISISPHPPHPTPHTHVTCIVDKANVDAIGVKCLVCDSPEGRGELESRRQPRSRVVVRGVTVGRGSEGGRLSSVSAV